MSIYYYLYQVTNTLNGHIYIGVRKSRVVPENDTKYMGSGSGIKSAILKYGIENFNKSIISVHNTWEEALSTEAIIVNAEFVLREDTYNLTLGGFGGSVKGHTKSAEFKRKLSIAKKGQPCPHKGKHLSENHRQNISESNKGKIFTEEHKQNLSKARQLRAITKPVSKETKQKMSAALTGRPRSEEVKRKISETKRRKALESKN